MKLTFDKDGKVVDAVDDTPEDERPFVIKPNEPGPETDEACRVHQSALFAAMGCSSVDVGIMGLLNAAATLAVCNNIPIGKLAATMRVVHETKSIDEQFIAASHTVLNTIMARWHQRLIMIRAEEDAIVQRAEEIKARRAGSKPA